MKRPSVYLLPLLLFSLLPLAACQNQGQRSEIVGIGNPPHSLFPSVEEPGDTGRGRPTAWSGAFDILYIRTPRVLATGNSISDNIHLPEVGTPLDMDPGTDLMLLHPSGDEEVLFAGGIGAVLDASVSLDGQRVYFSYIPDARYQNGSRNEQRGNLPRSGADIYVINLATRQTTRLTHQEWTPATGAALWSNNPLSNGGNNNAHYLGYGIFNTGPQEVAGGRIMFTSSRESYLPANNMTYPNLRLYVMDRSGNNVEPIGHLNVGSALHPTPLMDGRVMFSSYEAQGVRDHRLWALWSINPDGRSWGPLMSAFEDSTAFHFQTQLSNGDIVVIGYYNFNNEGFGAAYRFPASGAPANLPPFGAPDPFENPGLTAGFSVYGPSFNPLNFFVSFPPYGISALTPFTHPRDEASNDATGAFIGKVTHPSAAPNNGLLLVYSPGPANGLMRPTNQPAYDAGIYLDPSGGVIDHPSQLVLVKNDPAYNELFPRAVVPYSAIYGIPAPVELPFLPNDGSINGLPEGTPFGLIGSSSLWKRDTMPGYGMAAYNGLEGFNPQSNANDGILGDGYGTSMNWTIQGAEAGRYDASEIFALRILLMEPASDRSMGPYGYYGPNSTIPTNFGNHAAGGREKLRILGEIPVLKYQPNGALVLDPEGNPDTSFLAKIPADVPFTFQAINRDGMTLNMAQTWHQVRPGEKRVDCGGCHAHNQVGLSFESTAAAQNTHPLADLTLSTIPLLTRTAGTTTVTQVPRSRMDVEYYRDIRPILQTSCVGCHSVTGTQAAQLALDDETTYFGFSNTWRRLCQGQAATHGIPPVHPSGTYLEPNASRYVRMFQARRSLLIWKIFGARRDGWTNGTHPTESTPGNPATLPAGANVYEADLDYTGTIMPPPGSPYPALTDDQKMMFARWVDLGCPINNSTPGRSTYGYFRDELPPTVTIASPRAGNLSDPVAEIRLGAFDIYSGLNPQSLSVKASFPVNGHPAGAELASLFTNSQSIWRLPLSPNISNLARGTITVRVRDQEGNWKQSERTFSVQ